RVRILCELAVLRDGVDGFVLVSPDRHGGRPEGWSRIAIEFAGRGFAVLVIVGGAAAAVIAGMPEAQDPAPADPDTDTPDAPGDTDATDNPAAPSSTPRLSVETPAYVRPYPGVSTLKGGVDDEDPALAEGSSPEEA